MNTFVALGCGALFRTLMVFGDMTLQDAIDRHSIPIAFGAVLSGPIKLSVVLENTPRWPGRVQANRPGRSDAFGGNVDQTHEPVEAVGERRFDACDHSCPGLAPCGPLLVTKTKKKFPEPAGNPKLAYETPAPPTVKLKTQKRDPFRARNFSLSAVVPPPICAG